MTHIFPLWDRPHIELFASCHFRKLPVFVFTDIGSTGGISRCISSSLDRDVLHMPFPSSTAAKSAGQDPQGDLREHSYCTPVVQQSLVPKSTQTEYSQIIGVTLPLVARGQDATGYCVSPSPSLEIIEQVCKQEILCRSSLSHCQTQKTLHGQ